MTGSLQGNTAPASGELPPAALFTALLSGKPDAGRKVAYAAHAASQLGLIRLLEDAQLTLEELAERTGSHAASLHRLMRLLTAVDVFAEPAPGEFCLAPL